MTEGGGSRAADERRGLTSEASELFDPAFLRKLEVLRLVSRRTLGGIQPAGRRGLRSGAGLEFSEHRPYSMGDDFRYLDWAAYGRLERLLLRLFQQDEDLEVVLLVDLSGSMETGDPPKLDYARRLAAALAYVALGNLDRLHLLTFARGTAAQFDCGRGRGQIFGALNFLASADCGGRGDLASAAIALERHRLPAGLAVVVSDLLDVGEAESGLGRLQRQGHEVWALRVESAEEVDPPWEGEVELADAEYPSSSVRLEVTPQRLEQYKRRRGQWAEHLRRWSVEHSVSLIAARSDRAVDDLVLEVLRRRGLLG